MALSDKAAVQWVVTCEHGGNRVPAPFVPLFAGQAAALQSHRGYDIGALPFARRLAAALAAPLFAVTVTRLLVELNRSLHHRRLFSDFTAGLSSAQRAAVLARHYRPHRDCVEAFVRRSRRRVVHIGVHSFTPRLGGVVRQTDIGLLYDPQRATERAWCRVFKQTFAARTTAWRLRFNYPYRGAADGFTTYLRRVFDSDHYLGIELEVNQGVIAQAAAWNVLSRVLLQTFKAMP